MRLKKGFTLAEVLIVLMVIGVIATLTVPSLMNGVQEAQFKTGFKKAYNTVTNIASMEKISGQLPAGASADGAKLFFQALNTNLSVREYATQKIGAASTLSTGAYHSGLTFDSISLGTSGTAATFTNGDTQGWIVSDDNLAYTVVTPGSANPCSTKAELNAESTFSNTYTKSCEVVVVDVNGLSKGPNILEAQVTTNLTTNKNLTQLKGDQYYIFVAMDGVAAGNKAITVSGRLVSDVK